MLIFTGTKARWKSTSCSSEEEYRIESGEPAFREEAKTIWDRWCFATKERFDKVCEMAEKCSDSKEEEDP